MDTAVPADGAGQVTAPKPSRLPLKLKPDWLYTSLISENIPLNRYEMALTL
jgi:hypothetical protein